MDKKQLIEIDIRTKFIIPALLGLHDKKLSHTLMSVASDASQLTDVAKRCKTRKR
jgi:hypothetical protein